MGNKSHFFRQSNGLSLLADYQFNNNLIDDANGYNLTGTDITYNNDSAVFNGTTSEARRTDANDIFSFTDGVKDLPFKIELLFKFNSLSNGTQFLLCKRDSSSNKNEWQLTRSNNEFAFTLFSEKTSSNYIQKKIINTDINIIDNYLITITYYGNGINGLNIDVNGVNGQEKNLVGNYLKMQPTQSELVLGIASFSQNNNGLKFNGEIKDLKIYKP